MTGPEPHRQDGHGRPSEPYISDRLLTIPNLICGVRLAGSFVLVAIAWLDQQELFLWFFLFLAMTDWVDGKLAILLNQRSIFGARLDSWADAALYTALLLGAVMMHSATLGSELAWIIPAVAAYLISTAAGFWKYHRWPSYHTRAAKISWFLVVVGAIGLFSDWSLWPLRIALAAVTITNIEAVLITIISPTWRADVTSIYHAWRDKDTS
ncbi:MAG: CDP-alcohol phosphatidyltransferase family protein [Desulfurivibrionaceae bacterium]|nr:CDP-alcohol phosphatidyltransferase family protein [Desulfurivibrionaceae bacterium]